MINGHYAQTMAAYNAWMNDNLYRACGKLTDAQRKKDTGAFFKSIHSTLNHLLLADRVWMGRFLDQPFKAASLDQELYASFEDLGAERRKTDTAIKAWAASLNEETLAATLHYTPMTNPQPRTMPLALAVMHFFNHQAHHRGQVSTLLMQAGVDPGVTDLAAMPARDALAPFRRWRRRRTSPLPPCSRGNASRSGCAAAAAGQNRNRRCSRPCRRRCACRAAG